MSNNKNDSKSMFLYTALIFFVAVILIILSFFGQTNLQKNQPKVTETPLESQTLSGISEKAAVLSEENRKLLEENTTLKDTNKSLIETNASLTAENSSLSNMQKSNEILLSANGYFTLGNNQKALEMLNLLDYDALSGDQKILYDTIKNNL